MEEKMSNGIESTDYSDRRVSQRERERPDRKLNSIADSLQCIQRYAHTIVALTSTYAFKTERKHPASRLPMVNFPFRSCSLVDKFYSISIRFNLKKSKNHKFSKCMDILCYKWFPIYNRSW